MNAFFAVIVLLAVAHRVWEILLRPAAFVERMAEPVERWMLAGWLWVFAVAYVGLPTPVALALQLPAVLFFVWCVWQGIKPMLASLVGLVRPRKA